MIRQFQFVLSIIFIGSIMLHSTARAQNRHEEYCSTNHPQAPAIVGDVIDYPDAFSVRIVNKIYGEIRLRTDDVKFCDRCPDGKPRSDEGLCMAPNQTCPSGQAKLADGTCLALPAKCPQTAPKQDCPAAPLPVPALSAEPDTATRQCRTIEDLRFLGSSTVGRHAVPYFLQVFADAYGFTLSRPHQINPEEDAENNVQMFLLRKQDSTADCFRVLLRSRGSETAKNQSRAEIRMSSRVFSDDEIKTFAPRLGQVSRAEIEHVVALDGVAIVVHKNNPLNAISVCDVAKIFSDENDRTQFNLHFRKGESGTSEFFQTAVKECGLKLSTNRLNYNTYDELLKGVANDPKGIGFSPVAFDTDLVKTLRLEGSCGLGKYPTSFNIKTEDYLLSRRLFLFTPEPLRGKYARQFMTFMTSDDRADNALHTLLAKRGSDDEEGDNAATDQNIELAFDTHADSASMKESREDKGATGSFQNAVTGARRLSIAFRFVSDSAELDVRARQDVQRLVRYFAKNPTTSKVLLAGFTDSDGSVAYNKAKAVERAEAVLHALDIQGIRRFAPNINVQGFGKILPVACNDGELGKGKNRRVEVYLLER